jgi:hypothetical protein
MLFWVNAFILETVLCLCQSLPLCVSVTACLAQDLHSQSHPQHQDNQPDHHQLASSLRACCAFCCALAGGPARFHTTPSKGHRRSRRLLHRGRRRSLLHRRCRLTTSKDQHTRQRLSRRLLQCWYRGRRRMLLLRDRPASAERSTSAMGAQPLLAFPRTPRSGSVVAVMHGSAAQSARSGRGPTTGGNAARTRTRRTAEPFER